MMEVAKIVVATTAMAATMAATEEDVAASQVAPPVSDLRHMGA
jgi:hypothetical protein